MASPIISTVLEVSSPEYTSWLSNEDVKAKGVTVSIVERTPECRGPVRLTRTFSSATAPSTVPDLSDGDTASVSGPSYSEGSVTREVQDRPSSPSPTIVIDDNEVKDHAPLNLAFNREWRQKDESVGHQCSNIK